MLFPHVRTPKCGIAHFDTDSGAFLLVLEDLDTSHCIPISINIHHEAALRTAARLHAAQIPKNCGPLPLTPVHLHLGPMVEDYLKESWAKVQTMYLDLDSTTKDLIELLCQNSVYTNLLQDLAQPPHSLIHGDFRPSNLKFHSHLKQVIVFDWQFISLASPAYDFAYYLGLALTVNQRRTMEEDLKRAYIDERLLAGDIYFAQLDNQSRFFNHDIQVGVLISLASFVIGAASAKNYTLHHRSITNLATAALDWNALTLLKEDVYSSRLPR
uniref:CHK kinase-like domain-containing protein n=1 Tax=Aureoumbra lagunensis TaxID=44058 RepID=A0A7S3NIE8_9STRA|mmetsp:Transcript_3280/g.4547  ORF Transcript_3280/g.4547 Transcript_3280/m.4547 type:complete len:270 (+) Transcript_3280:574-1383(+)